MMIERMETQNNGSGSNTGPEDSGQSPQGKRLGGFLKRFGRQFEQLPASPLELESPPLLPNPDNALPQADNGNSEVPPRNPNILTSPDQNPEYPNWWSFGEKEWLKIDEKERMIRGAARVILHYDGVLRYKDRNDPDYKEGYEKYYKAALEDFEKHSEQSRLYKREARVVEVVKRWDKELQDALTGVPDANRDEVKLKIYERDSLRIEQKMLERRNIGPGLEKNDLYSQEEWEKALERKEWLDKRIPELEGEINAKIDPNYLNKRDAGRGQIEAEIKLANADKEKKEEERRKLIEESEREKQLRVPEIPPDSEYKSQGFNHVLYTRRRQEILSNKDELKAQRDKARERYRNREVALERDPLTIKPYEIEGLPEERVDELQRFNINLDDDEVYNEVAYIEADKAADRFLFDAEKEGAFDNLKQPIISECVSLAEAIAEQPEQFLRINLTEMGRQMADNQSTGLYAGQRGEYVRRAFRNIKTLIDEVVTRKETDLNSLELTPGIDWGDIREILIEGKKWYIQSEYGTFRFKGRSATTLRLGVAQFKYDIVHGSSYYDQNQMLGDMQAFTKALRIIDTETIAKREGWTKDQEIRFRDSLRHEGENGISFTLMRFWGNVVMMEQMNGFYSQYWAKEGPGRLKDLVTEHDGYFSLATHLLHTKYKMIYNLEGFRGDLLGKTQVQGKLEDVYEKLLRDEMMEWELVGVPGDRRDELISLRAKVSAGEKLNSEDQKKLGDLEAKAREDLTTCQSEDEKIDRFQKRQGNLREEMEMAEKAYKGARDALEKRVEQRDDKYVILKEAGGDAVLSSEDREKEIRNLQSLRKNYVAVKKIYDQIEKKVRDGLELALQVDHVFGQAYELGPRKVRMENMENGDLLSIRDIDKGLRFAVMEEAQEEFKRNYGFRDNLALLRKRAVEWNGRFAEYAAIVNFWKFLDELNHRQPRGERLSEKQEKWDEFYKQVGGRWEEGFKNLQDEDTLKQKINQNKVKVSKGMSPYQRILQMVREEARESFVNIDITTDETDDSKTKKRKFNLAKGYEYTGLTVEQLPFVQRAWDELNKNGHNAMIGGKRLRDIVDMDELDSVESFFLGRYMGTREGQDSDDAIEGALMGELPWFNYNRSKLARTGRRGFVGLENLELVGKNPQQRNIQYIQAIADTVYFDRVMGILAYQFATTDQQGKFTFGKMTQGVPWNGTWGGNIEMDYPGYGITNIKRVIGRFPKILRGAPIREPSLARYIGFEGLHEAVGNEMFSPTDSWVFETWGKVKDTGQKFQAGYESSFNQELGVEYRMSDKLIDDADNLRVVGHRLIREYTSKDIPHIIARIMLEKSTLVGLQEEELIAAGIERWRRIILTLGPLAASYQNFRGAEDSRLGLEMNDLFHNSMILPTLLSEGEGPERWQEGGLDAYDVIVPMLALLTLPRGWNGQDNHIGHEYRKVRAGRNAGDPKSPTLVRI